MLNFATMKKTLSVIITIYSVLAMTIVSLLPHHHHCDENEAICFVMDKCHHDDHCNHHSSDTASSSGDKNCEFHKIDLPTTKQTDIKCSTPNTTLFVTTNIIKIVPDYIFVGTPKHLYILKFLNPRLQPYLCLRAPPVA